MKFPSFIRKRKDILIRVVAFLMNRPGLFSLLTPYRWWLRYRAPHPDIHSFSYQATLEYLQKLYGRSRPVMWSSLYFPAEFIHAAGGIPFYPEIASGMVAALGLAPFALERAGSEWFSPDMCSYHRIATGLSLAKLFPRPDILFASSNICSGTVPFFQTMASIWKAPLFLVDVPPSFTLESARYVREQLVEISAKTKEITGQPLQWAEPLRHSHRAHRLMEDLVRLRRENDTLFTPPGKNIDYLPYYYQFIGTQISVHFLEKLVEHAKKANAVPPEKIKAVWLHLKPFFPNSLTEMLENADIAVCAEEFTLPYWEAWNGEEVLGWAAKKMMASSVFLEADQRIAAIIRLLRETRAHAAMQFTQWGCRQSQGMNELLRRALREEGYPLLTLDGDHLDHSHYSEEQLRTRIDAFAETVKNTMT